MVGRCRHDFRFARKGHLMKAAVAQSATLQDALVGIEYTRISGRIFFLGRIFLRVEHWDKGLVYPFGSLKTMKSKRDQATTQDRNTQKQDKQEIKVQ